MGFFPYNAPMDSVNITNLIDRLAQSASLSPSYISVKCSGDSKFYKRLKAGGDVRLSTFNRIVQWFSDNWPADLLWPADLPRPAPSPDSPAVQARAAANDLNADGEIANLAAWCRRNAYEPNDARSVIRRYGAGGPREGRYPRRGSAAQFVLEQLIKTGDRRFATYHRYDRIANSAGLG